MTRQLSDQELRLWLRVARSIRPAHSLDTQLSESPIKPPSRRTESTPPPAERTASTIIRKPGAQPAGRPTSPAADQSRHRRIRRGQVEIDATIDLHGHTQHSAMRALIEFVEAERMGGARCLLVITGKGRAGSGVLRRGFLDWINHADIRPHVAGYSAANARHGGEGAFYLLLKRPHRG